MELSEAALVLVPPLYTTEGVIAGQDVVIPDWGQILPPRTPVLPVTRAHVLRGARGGGWAGRRDVRLRGRRVTSAAGYLKAGRPQVQRPSQTTGPSVLRGAILRRPGGGHLSLPAREIHADHRGGGLDAARC